MPYNYDQFMFQKLQNLRQGSRTDEEYATELFLLINRIEIKDSERQIMARFIGGLRQQIQQTLILFNPLTISEAHQQALTIEAQNRSNPSSWNSTRQRSATNTTTPTTTNTNLTPPTNTTIVPVDQVCPT